MHDLEIVWPNGRATFSSDDSPLLIGRSASANIVLSQGSVSRRHLEIVWEGNAWMVHDPSTHGTFDPIGVKLSQRWTVTPDTTVKVGGTEGVEISFNLVGTNVPAKRQSSPNTRSEDSQPSGGQVIGSWDRIPLDRPLDRPVNESADQAKSPAVLRNEAAFVGSPQGPSSEQADLSQNRPGHHFDDVTDQVQQSGHAAGYKPPATPGQHFGDVAPQAPSPLQNLNFDGDFAGNAQNGQSQGPTSDIASPEQHFDRFEQNGQQQQVLPANDHRPGLNQNRVIPTPAEPVQSDDASLFNEPLRQISGSSAPPVLEPQSTPATSSPLLGGDPSYAPQHNTNVSEAILRLSVDGQDYSFSPGTEITIGRDRSCLVHLDERHSLVSRRHLRITHQEGSWWLEDFSSKGTFVDDKQLKGRYQAEGAFIAHLGDRDTGTQVKIITAGTHVVPKNRRRLLPAALALLVCAALAGAAYMLLLRGDSQPLAQPVDAATAQRSTVMLVTIQDGRVASHSTGFMVSDDLVLTTGSGTDGSSPSLLGVATPGQPATVAYATSWVASHPFLDLAVLRVTNSARETEGGYVMATGVDAEIGLPTLGFAESSSVVPGNEVYVTGFPASPNITSTEKGVLELPGSASSNASIENFRMWPGCDLPSWRDSLPLEPANDVTCSESGNIEQALVSVEVQNGSAGLGSPVMHDGKVLAVVVGPDVENPSTVHAVTSESFADWLDDVTKANS